MRITGGKARGIPLKVPQGDAVRPATDGVRQAVFNSLAPRLAAARILDLCAGSGAYGLEALSRGAASCVFVEKNNKAASFLKENIEATCKSLARKSSEAARVFVMDAASFPVAEAASPELIFIDPPYDIIETLAPVLFERLAASLDPKLDPIVVFEMPGEMELTPVGWTCVKRIGKGRRQPSVSFFRLGAPEAAPAEAPAAS